MDQHCEGRQCAAGREDLQHEVGRQLRVEGGVGVPRVPGHVPGEGAPCEDEGGGDSQCHLVEDWHRLGRQLRLGSDRLADSQRRPRTNAPCSRLRDICTFKRAEKNFLHGEVEDQRDHLKKSLRSQRSRGNIWEFPKIRGTLMWGPEKQDPTI